MTPLQVATVEEQVWNKELQYEWSEDLNCKFQNMKWFMFNININHAGSTISALLL